MLHKNKTLNNVTKHSRPESKRFRVEADFTNGF